ncbi:hypothetical protein [Ureaplasma zalophigenitalium]|uniref:DUF1634 domain-containing protein n=1 Tax=Ureaplasma zalophigenitalium TaxID=907723 RepID=A0ABT3BP03_9BACT|nr:hypothetical protein [Ureaplasma zalophigenitalium]MCV3753992.1 hypothetical protein [Ureaplasma zalophigenitalium]
MMKQKHKQYFSFEKHLRSKKGLGISWGIILGIILLYSIVFGIILHFSKPEHLNIQQAYIVMQSNLTKPTQYMIYTGFACLYFPLLFLLGCWINSIKNIYRSLYYHGFIWFLYACATVFVIICICLIINIFINF